MVKDFVFQRNKLLDRYRDIEDKGQRCREIEREREKYMICRYVKILI